jgi:hypothetical protein
MILFDGEVGNFADPYKAAANIFNVNLNVPLVSILDV